MEQVFTMRKVGNQDHFANEEVAIVFKGADVSKIFVPEKTIPNLLQLLNKAYNEGTKTAMVVAALITEI